MEIEKTLITPEDMAILLVLVSGFILIHQMAEGKFVCKGEKTRLSCPLPNAEWRVKQSDSGSGFALVEWRSGRLFVKDKIPQSFRGRVLASTVGKLELSDFTEEMDGLYVCISSSNFRISPMMYSLKAVYCSLSPCLGKTISVEVGIYSSKDPVDTIELFVNETKIQELDSTLNTTFQSAPKLPFYITLSSGERLILEGSMVNGDVQSLRVQIKYKKFVRNPQEQTIKVTPKVCQPQDEQAPKKELEQDEIKRTHSTQQVQPTPTTSATHKISFKVYFLFVCFVACFVLIENIHCM